MKRLCLILFFAVFAIPLRGQTPIHEQRCFAQACMLNPWTTIVPGNTLVVIVRASPKVWPACFYTANCGYAVSMVSDNYGDVFLPAFTSTATSQAYVAFNVKGRAAGCCYSFAPPLLIGAVASTGYSGYGNSTGGYYDFDLIVLEYPPASGFDGNAVSSSYTNGGGNNTPRVYPGISTSSSKTLLVAWTSQKYWAGAPLHVTYVEAPWQLLADDGFLSVSTQEVTAPSLYDFDGIYDGYGFWDAGIIALAMK